MLRKPRRGKRPCVMCDRAWCHCDIDPEGLFEDGFEDDDQFFAALDALDEPAGAEAGGKDLR